MKIVFIAPFGIRPKGTVIARMLPLAAELQTMGHKVVIVAPPYTNPEDSGKVEVIRGVTLRNVRLGPKNKFISAPVIIWQIFKDSLAEKPDVVHLFKPKGYGGLAAIIFLCLSRWGFRMPSFFIDSDDWEGRGGMNDLQPYSWAEKLVFQFQEDWLPLRADGLTVASRGLESKARHSGVSPNQLLYLPNGVDFSQKGNGIAIRQFFGISPESPVLLFYTRFFEFSQEKLYFLISEIHRQVPDVRFLVVGKGRNGEEQMLQMSAVKNGFSAALIMAGWVEPEQIPDYLAAGDVAIYPFADTLLNRSKCPVKLTELLLAGIPVVADRVGQIAEYIESGTTGELFEPDDWRGMVDRSVELLLAPEKRRVLGKAGLRAILSRFNWREIAKQLSAFYLRINNAKAIKKLGK